MSPQRMGGLAYWACGGEVMGRCGPLARARAAEVAKFLVAQAERGREIGDMAAVYLCCHLALELADAVAAADDWRRAAAGSGARSVRV
jgi:hypothetical protein